MLVYMYMCDVIVVLNIFHFLFGVLCILNNITVYIGASRSKPTLLGRMVQSSHLQTSMWKCGLLIQMSYIHKSLRLKVSC